MKEQILFFVTPEQLADNKDKILALLKKYYAKVGKDVFDPVSMLKDIFARLLKGDCVVLVWGEWEGFITCDFKENIVRKRKEAVIWTVYNPSPEYKGVVLEMIESEAKKRECNTVVFFAENPMSFNKLVKPFGYKCTLGYFEKELKEGK